MNSKDRKMSVKYRLMSYFVHATIHMYSAYNGIRCSHDMTVADFRRYNEKLVKRVFNEGLSIMQYELSYEQMNKGIASYIVSEYKPQSVYTSELYPHKIVEA